MATTQTYTKKPPADKPCNDKPTLPTKRLIKQKKDEYCEKLKGLNGELGESEIIYEGNVKAYHRKKCIFLKTEKNYQIVRNLELKVGIELMQAVTEIKSSVTDSYLKMDEALVKALKEVMTTAKDAKVKFGELRETAGKLDGRRKDSSSRTQMAILGCKTGEDCDDKKDKKENDQDDKKPGNCDNVCELLEDLIDIPETLAQDIDIVFTSAAEIMGIQSFTNTKSLDKFQQDLAAAAKAFDDVVVAKITDGAKDLATAQKDLSDAIKLLTTSSHALYKKRSELGTIDDTKDFLCHHKCDCIHCGCDDEHNENDKNDNDGNDHERLKKCKCEICDICKDVKDIYCDHEKHEEEQC